MKISISISFPIQYRFKHECGLTILAGWEGCRHIKGCARSSFFWEKRKKRPSSHLEDPFIKLIEQRADRLLLIDADDRFTDERCNGKLFDFTDLFLVSERNGVRDNKFFDHGVINALDGRT